ncbi:MAG: GxxExxY protein [Calditrichaeota bacterium]|nr:GxxExxY protein [Calditrichota bacterium]
MDAEKLSGSELNTLSGRIIELAIRVHQKLGPGFLESVYQAALAYEFDLNNIRYEKEKALPVNYESIKLDIGFRCDFLIEENLILEIKAVKEIRDIDKAQLINYLKVTNLKLGLLINFNTKLLKNGIYRLVNNF